MKSLKLKYGTVHLPEGIKGVGTIMEFEDDQAKEQMKSGAWEDITESLKTKVEKKEDSGKDDKPKK